jgi:uncharacterized membrane protein YhaH (DUF805 family)
MRRPPDEPFKLSFPVAEDRTLRRISIIQVILTISIPVLFVGAGLSFQASRGHDPRWPAHYGEMNLTSPFYAIGLVAALLLFVAVAALIILGIIEGTVLTRRYGWRAVSDPIERQRIATREAQYDVATGSTQAKPDNDGDRIIIMPTRRLRPVSARLDLIAERQPPQEERQG